MDQLHGRDRWRLALLTGVFSLAISLLLYPIGLQDAWWFNALIEAAIGGVSWLLAIFILKKWRG